MIVLTAAPRRGIFMLSEMATEDGQTQIEVRVPFDASTLGVTPVAVQVTVEQSIDGVLWWPLGGMGTRDLRALSETRDKDGQLVTSLWGRFTEQVYRHDIFVEHNWAEAYELKNDADGAWYHQLALCPQLRVVVDTFRPNPEGRRSDHASLTYGVETCITRAARPATPLGRHSASLLGTFSAVESGVGLTTGSRTTVSGSLITATWGVWIGFAGWSNHPAATDSKSNTYTEPTTSQVDFGTFDSAASVGLSYNMAGTRGASHTVSHSSAGSNVHSLGAQEWSGVQTSPTVASASNTGTSTSPSASVGVSAASLALLVFGYNGATTAVSVNDGTQAQEIDETNDTQVNIVHYKVAQTGTPSITGTLAASREWGALMVTFTEAAAAGTSLPPVLRRIHTALLVQ